MKLSKTASAILFAGFMAAIPAQAASLKVAALTGWPPFSGENLPNSGFATDVTQTVLERLGHDVEVEVMPWARSLAMAERGKYDVLPAVWYSDERNEKLMFTDPIAENRVVFIKKAGDDFEFSGLEDLEGKSVGIVQDYDYRKDFLESENIDRQSANSIVVNARKLLGGRIDLTVGDELVSRHTINEAMGDRADEIAFTDGTLSSKSLHITVTRAREDTAELVEAINAELTTMRADGTYDEILDRHGLK